MVVRLVRAGVGALLLLIAVPLALAGGGLLMAMEHRADDDTFTARLERVRTDGDAVVVTDVDALLRTDAPFARGGQTTLSLSAVGSGGPLFIGLGPEAAVRRYLDGHSYARVSRVRLARGPLPVELATEAAARTANQTAVTGDAAPPPPADPAAPVDPAAVAPPAAAAPSAAAVPPTAGGAEAKGPAAEKFWTGRSELKAGVSRITWSPSAMRGKHLALVVMRADGTAGVDAAITARLAPAWLAPTTGGLLMLGAALFFLALVTLAWPQGRPAAVAAGGSEPAPLPVLPAQPTSDEDEATPEEPEAAARVVANERVMATLADVLAAADAEAEPEPEPVSAPVEPAETIEAAGAKAEDPLLVECELDRPAPLDADVDDHGPIDLPPLPAMPNIELHFTWAPPAASEDTAESGTAAR
ncbi:hypothetical protein [Dactylosporangium matsuzakiense]|uniref:Uncharacterized protein n=1 Tax=Dactylosporangium matsuzakiense TaxID=53360 RepID=A0A9W6KEQ4_9ACTN|nr:hypothetical protein [Dactylosporangium matsuzakiense]UWZ44018.1 hypothetical protein Dmats_42545 [Dactylosporangium matsuzakiense]GLL00706.1 hypothetical protein GCM10017581_024470 [Dactylosporangium matsuzakiense]